MREAVTAYQSGDNPMNGRQIELIFGGTTHFKSSLMMDGLEGNWKSDLLKILTVNNDIRAEISTTVQQVIDLAASIII